MSVSKSSQSSTTIRDVARVAGVSVGTASRSLNNQPGINENTRLKVLEVAQQLGYDFSNLRQQNQKPRRITFIHHRSNNPFSNNPFYTTVLQGAEEICSRERISLTFNSISAEDSIFAQIRHHDTEAVLCAGHIETEQMEELQQMSIPTVLVDGWHPGLSSVNSDNFSGAYQITEFLIKRGYRRIAFIGGQDTHYSISLRQQGYRFALVTHHLHPDPDLEVMRFPVDDETTGTRNAVQRLLALQPRPDAIVAYNDITAIHAIQTCQQAGLSVPGDIAVVGFDDIHAASIVFPALTTIRIDKKALGARGIELLMQRKNVPSSVLVPVELVVRNSTC